MKTGLALFLLPSLAFCQSFSTVIPEVAQHQKQVWKSPVKLLDARHLIPTAVAIAATAGLISLDPMDARYFHNTTSFNGFNRVFNGTITGYGALATPAILLAAGAIRHDSKMQRTAVEAGAALAEAEILTTILKDTTRRVSPSTGDYSGSFFRASGSNLRGNGSMPSGHTMSAFAVATVVSRRYGNHRWVPYVAYGLAGAVAFSRVTDSAHFASDAFVGGALGYSLGRLQ
jgi:membrane-associated phospholipid phosphatase